MAARRCGCAPAATPTPARAASATISSTRRCPSALLSRRMEAWLPERVKTLLRALLDGDAQLSPAVRKQLLDRAAGAPAGAIPPALAAYADRVAHTAYKIRDEDIDQLRAQGHSEDEIFE